MPLKRIKKMADRLQSQKRYHLSRFPIFYALTGGIAMIFFWRGVWHSSDWFRDHFGIPDYLDGPISIIAGALILLATGLIISSFIGEKIIVSDLKGEKGAVDKTAENSEQEENLLKQIKLKVDKIEKDLNKINER